MLGCAFQIGGRSHLEGSQTRRQQTCSRKSKCPHVFLQLEGAYRGGRQIRGESDIKRKYITFMSEETTSV